MKALQASLLAILAFALVSGCNTGESPASSEATVAAGSLEKGSGPSATGQGRIVGTDRVFAFNATTRPNGTVQGVGTLNRTSGGARFKFSIDCLSVSDNVATMTGTVIESNVFPNSVGLPCWFRVKDNGEGSNAEPDEITFWYFCDGPEDCDIPTCSEELYDAPGVPAPLYLIEQGNIQVKP